jgi:hypothetical protein
LCFLGETKSKCFFCFPERKGKWVFPGNVWGLEGLKVEVGIRKFLEREVAV